MRGFPSIRDLQRRTNGGRLDHVPDRESLDRLVLGCASRAVGAANGLDVAAALLVTSAVTFVSGCVIRSEDCKSTWTLAS